MSAIFRMAAALAVSVILASCGAAATDPQQSATGDTTPPTVTSVTPDNAASGVSLSTTISATFSEPITTVSASPSSFTLISDGGALVAGVVGASGNTATFAPSARLASNTRYTASISSGVRDSAGNGLAENYTWSFTTGAVPDVTAPTVTGTSPQNGATGVAFNTVMSVTFSEAMTNSSLNSTSFVVAANGAAAIPGVVKVIGTTATFAPTADLAPGTLYTVTITTAARDASGNALADNFVLTFTTGATPDTNAPTIVSNTPASGATGIARSTGVTATFSEPMSEATITTASFTLTPTAGGSAVAGTVDVVGTVATFLPAATLAASTQYTALLTTAVMDAAGNPLTAAYSWSFTTAALPDLIPPIITASTPANNATGVARTVAPTVTFSEPMQNATLNASTFTLAPTSGGGNVAGIITVSGNTATFTPAAVLAGSTQYTVTITTGAKDAAGNAILINATWRFTTAAAPDVTPPAISAHTPANGAIGVPVTATATVTFSEPMDNTSITAASVSLRRTSGGAAVAGTVFVIGNTATFTPGAALAAGTQYTTTVTTAVKDVAGNALAADSSWSFTTAAPADVTPPTISGFTPSDGATGIVTSVAPTVTFSEPMQNATITTTTFTLAPAAGGANVSGVISVSGNTATFTPSAPLAAGTAYRATVTTGVRDVAGNALAANATWTFTTAAPADVTPPVVSATTPAGAAINVSTATTVTATFSEPMQNATITTTTFTLAPAAGGANVSGVVSVSGNTATFTPSAPLAAGTAYRATVTTGVRDVAGNALAANATWTFTTAAPGDVTPPVVSATTPAGAATGVSTATTVTATFSEPMQNATITSTSFTLTRVQGSVPVTGTVTVTGNTATFRPSAALTANRDYTAVITTAVKDAAGNALAATFTWTFRTAP